MTLKEDGLQLHNAFYVVALGRFSCGGIKMELQILFHLQLRLQALLCFEVKAIF